MTRVVVVGAGIIGLSAAYELAKAGAKVTVIDAMRPGAGASSAANGAITPHSEHSVPNSVSRLAAMGASQYPSHLDELRERTGMSIDYWPQGVLEVALGADEYDSLRGSFDQMSQADLPVEWIPQSDLASLEPGLTHSASAGVLYTEEVGIDIDQLMQATEAAASTMGVEIRCPVVASLVAIGDDGVVVVQTNEGPITTESVVIATGAGSCGVADMPDVPIERIRGEILEVAGDTGLLRHCVYRGDGFITPKLDGRLLLGTSYVAHADGMDENRSTISAGGGLQTLSATIEVVPAIAKYEITALWKGWRPASPDLLPIIGPYGSKQVVLAMGFGGLGFTLATVSAQAVRDYVLDGDAGEDLKPFLPNRPSLRFS